MQIEAEATIIFRSDAVPSDIPVTIQSSEGHLMLFNLDSQERAGSLVLPALSEALEKNTLTLMHVYASHGMKDASLRSQCGEPN